ncbi:MAG TPA: DUF6702 family protein [Longimicrobiales bacterium]|nr:DUF6702 family protein [Longimicrobiales bacterium]
MSSRKTSALLLASLLALAPTSGAAAGASGARPHKLHLSSGSAAVEGTLLVVRIRFFRDDLELALAGHTGRSGFALSPGPEVDAAFLAYFQAHFTLVVDGEGLRPTLVGSGEDELDREPVWWYAVQFEASAPIQAFTVRNTLLTEVFDDQRNIVKFIHFPDQKQKTYSFAIGEEEFQVRF